MSQALSTALVPTRPEVHPAPTHGVTCTCCCL